MATLAIWWTCIFLECLILLRIAKNGLIRAYPFFSAYLASVLVSDIIRYVVYRHFGTFAYQVAYWSTEFFCILAGYCVVLEVLEASLASYDGPRKFARNVGLTVFASIVGLIALEWLLERRIRLSLTTVEVHRDLSSAELILLAFIITVLVRYGIAIGRNLKGIIVGYGLCVVTVVMDHAIWSYHGHYTTVFATVLSISYLASLLIWMVALWAYKPNPVPIHTAGGLSDDYQALARRIKQAVGGMKGQVGRAARQ